MIRISDTLFIREDELSFTASASGGPGGQNVNRVNTRVTLVFDVNGSTSLSEYQKTRIRKRLSSRINKEGMLRVICRESRSQWANRELAVGRLIRLLKDALKEERPRRKTRIPARARRRRLDEKKRQAGIKKQRSTKTFDEY
ncbi:MAG: aminoacyl-tRNA hydrolase [Deltaproteobacteria bacterium]|nr:aminoacyl-tRNA hydrolase [Deltaproteobacteria bacterium]